MTLPNASSARILVVGDIILDEYFHGEVNRISPEAPVPVVRIKYKEKRLGGAGNVAHNIASLGGQVSLLGFVGDDEPGQVVAAAASKYGLNSLMVRTDGATTSKIRILGDQQQIVRVDHDTDQATFNAVDYQRLILQIEKALPLHDLVVLSDYAKGVCTAEVCSAVLEKALQLGIRVIADPKGKSWARYSGVYLITPNIKELAEAVNELLPNEDAPVSAAARQIREEFKIDNVLVTRSEKGMTLVGNTYEHAFPTEAREVFDVSGAGDTVVACLATQLASGLDLVDAVKVANVAAGIVVGKLGTAVVTFQELQEHLSFQPKNKIFTDKQSLNAHLNRLKAKGEVVVFTNGCFDILHVGHVQYLRSASKLGDLLVVGINSDSSVKRLKGPNRPVNRMEDRAVILAALEFVDYVVNFDEDTPFELLSVLRPDILVKGGDYRIEDIVGREFAKETRTIQFVDGYSTTRTIARMKE